MLGRVRVGLARKLDCNSSTKLLVKNYPKIKFPLSLFLEQSWAGLVSLYSSIQSPLLMNQDGYNAVGL